MTPPIIQPYAPPHIHNRLADMLLRQAAIQNPGPFSQTALCCQCVRQCMNPRKCRAPTLPAAKVASIGTRCKRRCVAPLRRWTSRSCQRRPAVARAAVPLLLLHCSSAPTSTSRTQAGFHASHRSELVMPAIHAGVVCMLSRARGTSSHVGTRYRKAASLPAEVALFALAGDSAAVLDRDRLALKLTAESDHKVGQASCGRRQRSAHCTVQPHLLRILGACHGLDSFTDMLGLACGVDTCFGCGL